MRLIDADDLLNKFNQDSDILIDNIIARMRIVKQPTAYDIDKVVEELKILKKESLVEFNIGEYNLDNNIGNKIAENYRQDMNEGRCFAFDEAIEIVTQCGVGKES